MRSSKVRTYDDGVGRYRAADTELKIMNQIEKESSLLKKKKETIVEKMNKTIKIQGYKD